MLWVMGLFLGAVMLLFLIRRLNRKLTSFEDYREEKEQAHHKAESALHAELLTLPPSETLAPVAAGVREVLQLHGTGLTCSVKNLANPPRVEVQLPSGRLVIQYRLRPVGYVRTGCYWEVDTGDATHVCRDLDAVMHHIEERLRQERCVESFFPPVP